MTLFDIIFASADTSLRALHGETATYKAGGTGAGTSITVMVATSLPQIIAQTEEGRDNRRDLYISVKTSDVATPNRGDTYTLTSMAHAGTYTHANVEKRNGVRWLIRCVKDDLDELGAQKARETRQ